MKYNTTDKWIPVQSVAERLSCTDKYIYYLIQQGILKVMKLVDRAFRISEQSMGTFIAGGIVNPEDYFAPVEEPLPETDRPKLARSTWMKR